MTTTVTALLVSHDGARWLPAVLDGLHDQTRVPDRLVALDTGSTDASVELLAERLGADAVHDLPVGTGFGAAVAEGLEQSPAITEDEWVWLLHDDSRPAPDALERLLDAAANDPGADLLGPKLREWPSLRRLLEVGVTISGAGRRETGLERGEYDQGQHDRLADVLAVNTAGMLVRRSVLEALGFDPHLPIFGNDLDLGWRVARAGHRSIVVPEAVVFHVEAAHRGVRVTPLTGKRHRRGEREALLYLLLVNSSAWSLPFRWVRLLVGSFVRALGLLLVRAPAEAGDEIVALFAVYSTPWRVIAGRARRRRTATVPHRHVRHLLAPFWVPYRHGLDFVTDLTLALAHQASDLTSARRARSGETTETGPVPVEAENLPEDTSLVARLLTSPAAAVLALVALVALWSARGLIGGGSLSGGALLPAPGSAGEWWSTYFSSAHDLGTGSSAPAAPYLVPLAALGTVLLGKAWLVVDLVLLLCVPLAALGARRTLLEVTGSRAAALWGAVGYGLLPVLGGAVQQGRIGTCVVAIVLPWLVRAALFLHPSHSRDRRQRAAWRTSLWLALAAAFAPLTWLLAAGVAVAALVAGAVTDRRWRRPGTWVPVLLPLVVSLVLLLPWTVLTWDQQGAASWLTEAGITAPDLLGPLAWTDLAFGRPGVAAPWWLGIGVVLAAVAALARADRRRPVLAAWLVALVALATAAVLAPVTVTLGRESDPHRLWLGVPLLVAQGAAVCAAALAGTGIRGRLTGASFGWRQPIGAAVVILALLSPVAGLVWWAVSGSDRPLDRRAATTVPTYMSDAAVADPAQGVLVVRGSRDAGFSHTLVRGPGLRLGDDTVLPTAEEQQPLTDLVGRLATVPEPTDVTMLQDLGVGFVFAPSPADPQLAANLDSVSGLSQGSATRPGSRAWQVQRPEQPTFEPTAGDPSRPWLLALQGVTLLVAGVLAAPTRKAVR